jgi:hypothetical protein
MFEKFLRKPKAERGPEQERLEKIAELGERTLVREAALRIELKRNGGFMLCTVLAMALAMGMTGKAEAQTKWLVEEKGFGRQLAGQIFNRGIFEAGSAIDRAHGKKIEQIENNYVSQLTALEDAKRKLDNDYLREKSRIMRSGAADKEARLQELNARYQEEATRLNRAEMEVRRSYAKGKRGEQIRHGLTDVLLRGARGW